MEIVIPVWLIIVYALSVVLSLCVLIVSMEDDLFTIGSTITIIIMAFSPIANTGLVIVAGFAILDWDLNFLDTIVYRK